MPFVSVHLWCRDQDIRKKKTDQRERIVRENDMADESVEETRVHEGEKKLEDEINKEISKLT